MLNKYTFTKLSSAVYLYEVLLPQEEYQKYITSVSKLLDRLAIVFNSIDKIDDRKVRMNTAKLWRSDFIEKTEEFPQEIKINMRNVITAFYRKFLHEKCKVGT